MAVSQVFERRCAFQVKVDKLEFVWQFTELIFVVDNDALVISLYAKLLSNEVIVQLHEDEGVLEGSCVLVESLPENFVLKSHLHF